MKKHVTILTATLLILLVACKITEKQGNDNKIFWVNSVKIKADAGAGTIFCMQISKQPKLKNADWEIFYDTIEGFNLKTGYYQKIKVSETVIPADSVPADGSSLKYTLIEIIEEQPDPKWRLNDIWAVDKINDEKISIPEGSKRPQIELHLLDMRLVGSDGCNHIIGSITNLTETEITFSNIAGTLMMCGDMTNSDNFNQALPKVKTYKINNLMLTLYDTDNNKLIEFKKID